MFKSLAAVAFVGLMSISQPALAGSQTFDFTLSDPAAGLGSGPYASVTVTENAGTLVFLETLAAGFRIHDTVSSNHNAFAFSILGDPTITISGLPVGFTAVNPSSATDVSAPPYGSFFTAISCDAACGSGYAGGFAGPLQFTVSSTSALTLASLGFNTSGTNHVYFTSDIVRSNGSTGNAGAVLSAVPAVPEPATWAMMLVGFGAMGVSMRRRRRTHTLLQAV